MRHFLSHQVYQHWRWLLNLGVPLVIALILTAAFAAGFRRRTPGSGIYWLFLVILLVTWAGGLWITPFGPVFRGARWLPFLVAGLVAILLIATATIPERRESTVELVDPKETESERKTAFIALGVFFWVLVAVLVASIVVRYI